MKRNLCLAVSAIVLAGFLVVGCSKSPTEPAPQPTNTPVPAATAIPVATATPGGSGAPVATATPGAQATATPIPSGNCKYEVITQAIGAGSYLTQADYISYKHDSEVQVDISNQAFPWQQTTNVNLGTQASVAVSFVTANFITNHPEINNTKFTLRIYKNGAVVKEQDFTIANFVFNVAVINIYF
jgi:hypothetical protein